MNDAVHRTDTLCTFKKVTCGEQIKHWIEFQLLDEQGSPLANLPYRATNEATCTNYVPEYTGQSDAEGVIRIEGLHPLPLTLLVQADALAEQLQNRRLRAERAEPPRPGMGDRTQLYGPQRSGFSPIEKQANDAGHLYHYLRIGQLCDGPPTFEPPLANPDELPAYHFPDPKCAGLSVEREGLSRRHVLEVCPFRAWSLVLHHQKEYSLANAYNLGLMSELSYSENDPRSLGSVEEFFLQQCLDLSRTPRVWGGGQNWPCLVADVPFSQRYTEAEMLDTDKADPPEGDTQLFYAVNATQVLVGWRGTENKWTDWVTDGTFRPVKPEVPASCEPKVPCTGLAPVGSVHLGFRDAYEVACRVYAKPLVEFIPSATQGRQLFICGHSLGGALGLIHSATLKDKNPLLYTYGMPRTFTLKAVEFLNGMWHFRHVNDADIVPRVPPDADLDNSLYDIYGPMGVLTGATWSIRQALFGTIYTYEDPYCHHGEIAMFFRAEQHTEERGNTYPSYPNGVPYNTTLSYPLANKAKLYLVPSLGDTEERKAEEAQKCFMASLSVESRSRFFPRYDTPEVRGLLSTEDHKMMQYLPYVHNQLLESINPVRKPLLERQTVRQKFEQQMQDYYGRIPETEYERNRVFLELQTMVSRTLAVTREEKGGTEALQRFDAVADPKAYFEKTYG
ncbi:lipase family protein [Pseudomonas caspiana]